MSKNKQKKNQMKTMLLATTALTCIMGWNLTTASYAQEGYISEETAKQALQEVRIEGSGASLSFPTRYEQERNNFTFEAARSLRALAPQYSSKNTTVRVKDQGQTGSCWAFSATTTMEHYRYKNGGKADVFSPKHLEYATSSKYADGTATGAEQYSDCVYNRQIDDGGNSFQSMSYMTSGTGPVLEANMPFTSPNNKINISSLNTQKADIEVGKYIILPKINKNISSTGVVTYVSDEKTLTSTELTAIRNEIKSAIVAYGAVESTTYSSGVEYYSDNTEAYFCDDATKKSDHAITIIGWDDNYAVTNFNANHRPSTPGAYIVQNSHGTNIYDNGYLYISYEDVNIENVIMAFAEVKNKSYDNIYQYDNLGTNYTLRASTSTEDKVARQTLYAANVFTRKTSEKETLYQVGINVLEEEDVEIYIVPNYTGETSLKISNATKASAKVHLEPGYQTITLTTPIELTNSKFAVIAKFTQSTEATIPLEINFLANNVIGDDGKSAIPQWDTATGNAGESFYTLEASGNAGWFDFHDVFLSTNTSIKAFTTTEQEQPTTPGITFGTNGSTTYARTATTTVTTDIANIKTLKHQWTQSKTQPGAATFTETFTNGQAITKSDGSGDWYLWVQVTDTSDKITYASSNKFCLDNTTPEKPTITANNGITSGKFTTENITLQVQGQAPLSGIQKYQFNVDDGTVWNDLAVNNARLSYTDEGKHTVKVRSVSNVGIVGAVSDPFVVGIDRTPPELNLVDGQTYETLRITFTDISELTVTLHRNQVPIDEFKAGDVITEKNVYRIRATDECGHSSLWVFRYGTDNTVTFDKTGPAVTFGTNGSTIFRKTQNTMVTVTDDMDADVTTYKYLWKQGTTEPAKAEFQESFPSGSMLSQKTGTGKDWCLWIYAKDTQGNETITKSNPFYLDNTPPTKPTIELNVQNGAKTKDPVRFKISGGTALSGIQKYQYSYDGVTWKNISMGVTNVVSTKGKYTVKARAVNTLGATGEYAEASFEIVEASTPTEPDPGDTPGGDTPGDNPGGNTGDTPGGDTPGDNPGGNTGDTPGGDTPGDNPGGSTGETPGGNSGSGNNSGNNGGNSGNNGSGNSGTNIGNGNSGGSSQGPNGGITIGSGNGTSNSGGTQNSGNGTSNIPTGTQGNLDNTKKPGIIPQTGESLALSIVVRTAILLVAAAAIAIYEKIIRIDKRK